MTKQPGYDALAVLYDETFPTGYSSPVERHAVELFAEAVIGVDPSRAMLEAAFQALEPRAPAEVEEFDHVMAPAWRWAPDAMAATLARAGLIERCGSSRNRAGATTGSRTVTRCTPWLGD